MPARNIHHAAVVKALIADGWTITHDPYPLSFAGKDLFVDLGAEEAALAAEKQGRRIAVEIQSFLGRSPVRSLEEAVGQYEIYRLLLAATDAELVLYMAVSSSVYRGILAEQFGKFVVSGLHVHLVVFDEKQRGSYNGWTDYLPPDHSPGSRGIRPLQTGERRDRYRIGCGSGARPF